MSDQKGARDAIAGALDRKVVVEKDGLRVVTSNGWDLIRADIVRQFDTIDSVMNAYQRNESDVPDALREIVAQQRLFAQLLFGLEERCRHALRPSYEAVAHVVEGVFLDPVRAVGVPTWRVLTPDRKLFLGTVARITSDHYRARDLREDSRKTEKRGTKRSAVLWLKERHGLAHPTTAIGNLVGVVRDVPDYDERGLHGVRP